MYATYGTKIVDGEVPYRDFAMEYPPAAAAMFALPATRLVAGGRTDGASWAPLNAAGRRYYRSFESLVALLMAAILVLTALTLQTMRRPGGIVASALCLVALSPLLIGRVLPERFDVWPAALTAAALAVAVRGRLRSGAALLGVGAAAKIYPLVLVPVVAIVALRRRGRREALAVAASSLAALVVVFLPFAIVSPSGTWHSVRSQFAGGTQIESVAASIVVGIAHVGNTFGLPVLPRPSSFATQAAGGGLIRIDLVGPGVGALTALFDALLAGTLLLVWFRLQKSRRDGREDLLRYGAGTIATVLVLGTVLSPQYVVWLIPLVPLVGGARGVAAMLLLALAAGLTNIWIPDHYFAYQSRLGSGPTALLVARNVTLAALALVLLLPGGRALRASCGHPDAEGPDRGGSGPS